MGLVTRQVGPNAKGSKLTAPEMDNNLYYLQSLGVSGVTYSANTLTITNPTGGTKSVIISADTNNNEYSSTTVNISSAQILSMGSTPIELLPAAGANKYYVIDWDNSYLEFSKGATPYNIGTIETVRFDFNDGYSSNFITGDFLSETNNVVIPLRPSLVYNISGAKLIQGYVNLNTSLILASYDSSNNPEDPTLGDGTIRAIISYKVRTFGS